MPECVSVSEFLQEVQEDWSSPTTSSFTSKMISCRNTVYLLEEVLDSDRLVLQKMKKAAKAKYTSGQDHVSHLEQYINSMEKLSVNCHSNGESEVGSAFCRLADFSKDLLSPMKNLLKSMLHNINFFLDSLVKGDLREVKGDLKKPFDKAWRDYESRFKQVEKEKRELARQYGMVRSEVSGGEIAEELEKERRSFQLSMCEYLIKVNEIKTKRGVDLLQNLIKHYHSHNNFLQECVSTTQRLKQYMEELNGVLTTVRQETAVMTSAASRGRKHTVKQRQEEEKKQLVSLRDQLRPVVHTEQVRDTNTDSNIYNIVQQDSLPKQTYSMHQLLGDKQYGTERTGFLYKKSDGLRKMWQKRKCSVHNCYLTIAHATDGGRRGGGGGESSVEDLTRAITDDIKRMPGNNNCCDCGAPDPGWLSTNLGILTCIECSGIHREMGVHVSRIQSLSLDSLGTSDLLLARNVGNSGFNEILEANLLSPSLKPSQHSHMGERKDFILSKYQDVNFVRRSHSSPSALRLGLQEATKNCDIYSLIQLYAQRTELSQPLHTHIQEKGETALHLAVLLADRTSLHILDFLAQNCSNVDVQTSAGNTALHYSCLHNKSDCLQQAQSNQFDHHVHVEYEWRLRHDDLYDSDDDFDDKNGPVKKERFSPSSSSSFSSSFSFSSRPFIFSQSTSSSMNPSSSGAAGGGLLSVGRRLAMAMELHSRPAGSASSPPPPPPSSPAPPLPPRVKAPNVPPPPPPGGEGVGEEDEEEGEVFFPLTGNRKSTPPPIAVRHKRSCSESSKHGQRLPSARWLNDLTEYYYVNQPRGTTSRRVEALYDCQADHHDELSFSEGQVLVVLGQEDSDWWLQHPVTSQDPGPATVPVVNHVVVATSFSYAFCYHGNVTDDLSVKNLDRTRSLCGLGYVEKVTFANVTGKDKVLLTSATGQAAKSAFEELITDKCVLTE
uniref:'Arf-GAP with SH3 domain, ANK repeat and PH domain-containing protein 1' n=1 Tax=Dicentrarchus labrax TaxID=13489 RepID=E6ZGF7_DICLA|nr:Arf-GAP with SH3 domain, ANK repeat and PH domain-containing protein 1 [Dicentrarchus labrax]